jgi:hypothetical protein
MVKNGSFMQPNAIAPPHFSFWGFLGGIQPLKTQKNQFLSSVAAWPPATIVCHKSAAAPPAARLPLTIKCSRMSPSLFRFLSSSRKETPNDQCTGSGQASKGG